MIKIVIKVGAYFFRYKFDIKKDDNEKTTCTPENHLYPSIIKDKNETLLADMKTNDVNPLTTLDYDFKSLIQPENMRCLALVSHNHMKPAMKNFVEANKNILKKFRLTGTNTTMSMLKEVFGNNPSIQYGPTCQSGLLGGDAELCALMCMEDLGGIIFLQDPMDAHPHQADIACLNRLAHVHNVFLASNLTSSHGLIAMFRLALRTGNKDMIAPFFKSEYSPGVLEYKRRQDEYRNEDENYAHRGSIVSMSNRLSRDVRLNNISDDNVYESFSSDSDDDFEDYYFDESLFIDFESDKEQDEVKDMGTEWRDEEFHSKFHADEMRCLALISHNHMKPAMRQLIFYNKNLLKKFRLTGTSATIQMIKEIFGDDPDVQYGPTCQSGPLGGDAELCALMCMENLGGLVFLQDPMDNHPHQADIDCLNRQCNVHDVYVANNPASAYAMMTILRLSLQTGVRSRMSSFFKTNISPSVLEYKRRQKYELDSNSNTTKSNKGFKAYTKKLRRNSRLLRRLSSA